MTGALKPPRPAEAAAWGELLDDLEGRLAVLHSMLGEAEIAPPAAWEPPAGLGPIPAHLRPRVEELVARLGVAQEDARERLDGLATGLQQTQRRRRAGEAYGGGRGAAANQG